MEKSLGLWEKTSKKGLVYFTGNAKIDGKYYKLVLFKNDNKKNEKAPDYNLMVEKIEKKEENKEENKENYLDDKVFADFGNQTADIKDEEIAF